MLTTIPKIRSKLEDVRLQGTDIPEDFNRRLLRTPFWGTPFGAASFPALAHLKHLQLSHIHFTHFSDLALLLRHFHQPERVELDVLTWDETDVPPHWAPRFVYSTRGARIKQLSVQYCTDDTLVVKAAHALDPRLPVQKLSERERSRVLQLTQALYAPESRDSALSISPLPSVFPCEQLGSLHVTCSQPEPHREPQVIGALLFLSYRWTLHHSGTALRRFFKSIIRFPGLRAICIVFTNSSDYLRSTIQDSLRPDLICRFLSISNHSKPQNWIEHDWRTKTLTGRIWKCDKRNDKSHHHTWCGDCDKAVLAKMMSSAVEEHMHEYPLVPHADMGVVE
ncbi:hypothetical protein BDW22DRAFT_1487128 [Trametopsis cervina]|nr:hypothetical protein BDW22DRAFT_1487128 [Trametopsis cervina]